MQPTNADDLLRTTDYPPRAAVPGPDCTADFAEGSPPAAGDTAAFIAGHGTEPKGTVPGDVPAIVSVPGYEILGELGRGGMGVVYKARQTNLNRLVALKMILAGGHAGEAELARFRNEAEAIARLQHPNIVQVYEVGEHEGKPFFSLEFCPGGSLDRQLDGTPLLPANAAKLVETLARAMHAAHQARLIHRDLKPANVLLTADGTPKITDFGLAKMLDDVGQTQSGAIMGTPSFMSPEQAGGKTSAIGPATDIYALGAILYDLLTGRPPFKAATPMDTILQVIRDEPVPPTQLQNKMPRDVETICLKCLDKVPTQRYATAEALADDLGRFQRGEPIAARPVGQVERGWRWCRRNPGLAGALVSVAAALLLGAAVSTYFGFDAAAAAKTAQDNEARAKKNETDAIAARNDLAKTAGDLEKKTKDLEKSAGDLTQARNGLETTLAHSLMRPLALQGNLPMTEPEWMALWDLATSRSGRLPYRFVEEATKTPVTSRQLRDRAALALHAAVGLDLPLRDEVEVLLLSRLEDAALGAEHKIDLARTAAAWDGLSSAAARRTAPHLILAMNEGKDLRVLSQLLEGLAAVAAKLEPREAVAVLTQAMKDTKNDKALLPLALELAAVSGKLGPKEAAQVVPLLTKAMKNTKDAGALSALAVVLWKVAASLEPKEVAVLTEAMKDTKNATAMYFLAEGLATVAVKLGPKEAVALLTQAMKDHTKDVNALPPLAKGLAAVAAKLEPREAVAVLTQAMKDPKNVNSLLPLAQGLAEVAAKLEPKEGVVVLTQAMKDPKNAGALYLLAGGLATVAAKLEAKEAVAVLIQAMKDTKDVNILSALAGGLAVVAAKLEAKEAVAVLTQAMKDPKNVNSLPPLAQGLAEVAAKLEPKEGVVVLTQAMKDPKNAGALYLLAGGLAKVAAKLEAKEAVAVLTQAMKDTKDDYALPPLAQGLATVAAKLEPKEGLAFLTQAMKDTKNVNALQPLAQGLAAVAAKLEPKEGLAFLTQAMKDTKDVYALPPLAQGLAAVAAKLEAKEAVAVLTQAMNDPKNFYGMQPLAQGLAAVAVKLEPKEAAQAAAVLAQAMKDPKNVNALQPLAQGLAAVAAKLEPKEAVTVLTQAMKYSWGDRRNNALQPLAQGLAAVAAKLEPMDAAQAVAVLTQAMMDTNDGNVRHTLAGGLGAVAARLEPKEAVAVLTQAMKDAFDRNTLQPLAQGLAAVSARLEPKEAAQVAANLLTLLSEASSPNQQSLAQSFSVALTDHSRAARLQRSLEATAAVSAAMEQPLGCLAFMPAATEPLPCRLSTPQLVELLKMPTCVGNGRRVVLDHLGHRYQRRFADQWEFVRFATDQKLGLDFTSPPLRPEILTTTATRPGMPRETE